MRKLHLTAITLLLLTTARAQENTIARGATNLTGKLIHTTAPLDSYKGLPLNNDVPVRDENGIIRPDGVKRSPFVPAEYPVAETFTEDPGLQKSVGKSASNEITPDVRAITANFAGMGFSNVNPPDPTLCVGPNHIIQMINGNSGALLRIYNKTGGTLLAQTFMDNITGRGGLGDPIALYDQLTDRFVITEFANASENGGSEGLIFAVSRTNNPTGAWNVYFFGTGTTFPDYPKFSIWNNAIYGTTNDFAPSYIGSTVYAFDKAAMYAGSASVAAQGFRLGNTSKFFSMCPVLLQGTTLPPAGTGGLIAYMSANEFTPSTTDLDSIGLLEFRVNFANPALSSIVGRSSLVTVAYTANVCSATRGQCVPMPGTTRRLESLQGRIMNQPVYRRFNSYEGITLNHTVDRGGAIAGIRWYELRKTTGNWFIANQATYSPDVNHRFMASTCYDRLGNIGVAHNVSGPSVFPSIRYSGRRQCDPANALPYAENVIIAGTASNGSTRYGDYSHLVADPDGLRFWFTGQYNAAGTWSTRIAAFTLDACPVPVAPAKELPVLNTARQVVPSSGLTIAPQPAKDAVTVSWMSNSNSQATLRLITAQGSVVFNKVTAVNDGINTVRIDVSSLPKGLYAVQVITDENSVTEKLVIE